MNGYPLIADKSNQEVNLPLWQTENAGKRNFQAFRVSRCLEATIPLLNFTFEMFVHLSHRTRHIVSGIIDRQTFQI